MNWNQIKCCWSGEMNFPHEPQCGPTFHGDMLISVITSAPAAARSAPLTPLNRINKLDSRAKRHFRQFFSVSDTPPRPQHLADWISRPLDLNISQLIWINYWTEQWPSCAVRMQMTVDSLGDWSEFVEMNSSQSDERTFENDAICCWSNGTFFLLKIVKIEKQPVSDVELQVLSFCKKSAGMSLRCNSSSRRKSPVLSFH